MSDHRIVAIQNPRRIDGTVYEVAGKAVRQVQGLTLMAAETLADAEGMIFNAELSRVDDLGLPLPEVEAWRGGPMGGRLLSAIQDLERLTKTLGYLATAAEYDPKKR